MPSIAGPPMGGLRPGLSEPCAGCQRMGLSLLACDDPSVNIPGSAQKPRFCAQCMIGKKVRVFWPVDSSWYTGTVQQYDPATGEHLLKYDDEDTEWVKIGESGSSGPGAPGRASPPAPVPASPASPLRPPPPGLGGPRGLKDSPMAHHAPNLHAAYPLSDPNTPPERKWHQIPGGGMPGRPGVEPPYNPYGYPGGPPAPSMYPPPTGPPGYPGVPGGSYGPYPGQPPFAGGPVPPPGGGHPNPYGYPPMMAMPNAGAPAPIAAKRAAEPKSSPPLTMESNKNQKRKSGPKVWTKEEDTQLLNLVQGMSMPMKWSVVAQSMPDRTGKQCRERYVNHLNPRLKTVDWSPVEDATVFHLYNCIGSHWAKMSKMVPGRTDNGIKNRFHNLRRQLEREDDHRSRLSKAEDFTDEIRTDRQREFPVELRGKVDELWNISDGCGVLAAQCVLGSGIPRNQGKFGPFRKPEETEQCVRCGLLVPSVHCGREICEKTGWCQSCTRLPPHVCGNLLRECLNLRRCNDERDRNIIEAWKFPSSGEEQ